MNGSIKAILLTALMNVACYLPLTAEAQEIEVLNIEITTGDRWNAATNDDVAVDLLVIDCQDDQGTYESYSYRFFNDGDLFENGATNSFRLTANLPRYPEEIRAIGVRKIKTGLFNGRWELAGLRIYYNDDPMRIIYENSSINHYMKDDTQNWIASNYPEPSCPEVFMSDPHPIPPDCAIQIDSGSGDRPMALTDTDCDGIPDSYEDINRRGGGAMWVRQIQQFQIFLSKWTGEPKPWSKRDVVSQFYYHDYVLPLDDGDSMTSNLAAGFTRALALMPRSPWRPSTLRWQSRRKPSLSYDAINAA